MNTETTGFDATTGGLALPQGAGTVRFAILGNSGSGKSSLAAALASRFAIPSLDLDTVAWVPERVGVPRDPVDAAADVRAFCERNASFVIEGCYEDLIAAALPFRPQLVYLDVGPDICERHCRSRPFEPHKYASAAAQDEQLEFLLRWMRDYYTRTGPLSRAEHVRLFDAYEGPKSRVVTELPLGGRGPAAGPPRAVR